MKRTCSRCGYENRERALLCNLCGALFERPARTDATAARAAPAGGADAARARRRFRSRTDFRTEQIRNRRFSLLLAASAGAILAASGAAFGGTFGDWRIGLAVAAALAAVLLAVAWRAGGAIVLSQSGARELAPGELPVLRNVTEEMAIAAGIPPPRLFVIEDGAPNAFATGRDPRHASIAVTRGLLDKLTRDELQGVLAHELCHVRNADVLYGTLVGVVVGSTALLCDGFLRTLRAGGGRIRSRGRAGGAALIVVGALLLAVLAPLVSRLLQMAVSRRREFLADASAVELTRHPLALASALEKIAADPDPLDAANRATQHLYIVNPVRSFAMGSRALLSTHPPTEARVRLLRAMGHASEGEWKA